MLSLKMSWSENLVRCLISDSLGHYIQGMKSEKLNIQLNKNELFTLLLITLKISFKTATIH